MDKNNLGCFGSAVLVVLLLIFLAGNVMIFGGEVDENNSANGLFFAVAIIGDIALVIGGIYGLGKHFEKKGEQKAKQQKDKHDKELQELKDIYVKPLPILSIEPLQQQEQNLSIRKTINHDVEYAVKSLKCKLDEYRLSIDPLIKKRKQIFLDASRQGSTSDIQYIKLHADELQKIKEQIDSIIYKINNLKIHILKDTNIEFQKMKKSLADLKNSKQIIAEPPLPDVFNPGVQTLDFNFFVFPTEKITINLVDCCFYLLPHLIICFNKSGRFAGAYNPAAISIKINKEEKWEYKTPASDAKVLTTSYLHTCKDGSPDLRYSRSNRATYLVEYAKIIINIEEFEHEINVSNIDAAFEFAKSVKNYSKLEPMFDNVSSFVMLLEACMGSSNGNVLTDIKKLTNEKAGNKAKLCTITE